jgi:hypothetical protein
LWVVGDDRKRGKRRVRYEERQRERTEDSHERSIGDVPRAS